MDNYVLHCVSNARTWQIRYVHFATKMFIFNGFPFNLCQMNPHKEFSFLGWQRTMLLESDLLDMNMYSAHNTNELLYLGLAKLKGS